MGISNNSGLFKKTVAAAATPEPLTDEKDMCVSVIIQALSTNTNPIYLGLDENITDHSGANPGITLNARETKIYSGLEFEGTDIAWDLNKIYCLVTTNGEGVAVEMVKRD